jgi:predicted GNAT superfamily acetyltransferase
MDIERTMAFMIEQQSKFDTDMAKINRGLDRTDKIVAENSAGIRELRELTRENAKAIRDLVEVTRLQSERSDDLERNLAKSYDRLARAQEETARRLNDFIALVSRHVAGGNGRGKKPGSK